MLRLLENAFASLKIESKVLLMPPGKFLPYHHPPDRGKLLIPQAAFFFKSVLPQQKVRGENYVVRLRSLNLEGSFLRHK